jgi:hypothetical protein
MDRFNERLAGKFEPHPKQFTRSGSASSSFTLPVPPAQKTTGTLQVSYTLSFNFGEEDITIKIIHPQSDSEQLFKDGKLVIEATARVEPAKYAKDVEWEIEDIQGSNKTIEPQRGEKVKITFDGLPEENNQFGEKKITARVRGKQDHVTVKVFFRRDGEDNPSEKLVKEPNWLYYWKQTSAAWGGGDQIIYGKGAVTCRKEKGNFGFYSYGNRWIYICDPARLSDTNFITGQYTEGIDMFAVTAIHEFKHMRNYDQWWRSGGGYDKSKDRDKDHIPSSEESKVQTCPGRWLTMNPYRFSTNRCQKGERDEHYLAWIEEKRWPIGTADKEDWACPGKQCGRK